MASPRSGASILITSAPSRRSRCDAYGPAITWLKSATRIPSSGFPVISLLTLYLARALQRLGNRARATKARHRVEAVTRKPMRAPLGVALIDGVEALLVGFGHVEELNAALATRAFARVLGRHDFSG